MVVVVLSMSVTSFMVECSTGGGGSTMVYVVFLMLQSSMVIGFFCFEAENHSLFFLDRATALLTILLILPPINKLRRSVLYQK